MREIKFRGKARITIEELDEIGISHNNGWIFGTCVDNFIVSGVVESNDEYISLDSWCPVIPETIGQYTGLKDKNGKEIFEGDVLGKIRHWSFYIAFENGAFRLLPLEKIQRSNWEHNILTEEFLKLECEIIGNIHDKF